MKTSDIVYALALISAGAAISLLVVLLRIFQGMKTCQSRRRKLISRSNISEADASLIQTVSGPLSLMVVLGSGGHTAEMITLMSEVYEDLANRQTVDTAITYVIGKTDHHSISKALELHKETDTEEDKVSYVKLPRAREVGQSWTSSVWTSLYTSLWAFVLILKTKPNMILINGPGTSAIVAATGFFLRILFPGMFQGRCKVIYIESFARVETLSMSGKLVYRFADRFLVQWEQLCKEWPLAEYYGRLC